MKIKNGFKYEKNGWTYISIKGNPEDRGFAHGYLLANEIQRAIKTMKFSLYDEHGLDMEFFILFQYCNHGVSYNIQFSISFCKTVAQYS